MRVHIAVYWFICLAFTLGFADGQNITSSIVGSVTDASGGTISAAQIIVRNQDTGISSQALVDQNGSYSVPNLYAGRYAVQANKPGFESIEITDIQVLAGQTVRQDITMKVGTVQQTVEVTGVAPLVHTDTQTLGESLLTRQVDDLPTPSRSIDALIALAPGVETSGSNPRISGSQYWGGNNYNLNGVSVNDIGNGGAAYTSGDSKLNLANMPDPDSLQEFKVDSGNLNAEYRNVASITMVTKQGTNSFHGLAYEYLQNTSLNANTLLLNATGQPRAPTHFDQFGGDLGGPILHNRLFFYGAYHGTRDKYASVANLNIPSTAMRNGDFSALCPSFTAAGTCIGGTQLYNPVTGQPFVRNQIPTSMFAPQAKALLPYLPVPTDSSSLSLPNGKANYTIPKNNDDSINGVDFRMDGKISEADSVYGNFHWSKGSPWFLASAAYPADYGNNPDYGYTDFAISATETHIFSPTALNEFRAAWVVHASVRTGQNTNFDPSTLFPQLPIVDNGGLPTMSIGGYTGMFYDYGKGYPFPEYDIELSDNFTKVKGRHTIKFGIDETGYKNFVRQGGPALSASLGSPLGSFTFNGQWTGNKGWPGQPSSQGNAFADFLLGDATSTNYAGPLTNEQGSSRDWELYVQDTFQVSSKLTLNFGVRYMYQSPWAIRDNRASFLDLSNSHLAIPENSTTLTAPPLAIASLLSAYPFETTSQAGWPTSYYQPDTNNFGPRFGFAYRPFAGNKTVVRGGWGVYYNFIPGFIGAWENQFNPPWRTGATFASQLPGNPTAPFLPDLTFANPFPSSNQAGPAANPLIYMTTRNLVNTVVQQWNFTLEQQIGNNWAARASYVGAQTHHDLWYAGNMNIPNVQQPNVPLQAQRPYQPWSQINQTSTGGKANLNQLQLELNKRLSSGFLVQAQYSFTRSMDDVPLVGLTQNPNNYNADYGNSDGIPRQVLVLNYVCDLPFGHGRAFNIRNRILDGVAGGWSLSGITKYQTGAPFSVAFALPSNIIGWQGGRANEVAGADLYAGRQSGHNIVSGVPWFNPAAFVAPAPWQWGNSERNLLYGPGFWNWDISLQKYFAIRETRKLQFRADLLDAFNHFNLSNPNATIQDIADGGIAQPLAGKITAGSGNRIVQLGLRFMF